MTCPECAQPWDQHTTAGCPRTRVVESKGLVPPGWQAFVATVERAELEARVEQLESECRGLHAQLQEAREGICQRVAMIPTRELSDLAWAGFRWVDGDRYDDDGDAKLRAAIIAAFIGE